MSVPPSSHRRGAPLARRVATGFGLGTRATVAPGTVASCVALLAASVMPARARLPLAAAAAAAGLAACARLPDVAADPAAVVIDEIAGQWIACLGLRRRTPGGLLAALLLFRVLDIVKPGPIGALDRRRDAMGVMGDDILAGLAAALALRAAPCLIRRAR